VEQIPAVAAILRWIAVDDSEGTLAIQGIQPNTTQQLLPLSPQKRLFWGAKEAVFNVRFGPVGSKSS